MNPTEDAYLLAMCCLIASVVCAVLAVVAQRKAIIAANQLEKILKQMDGLQKYSIELKADVVERLHQKGPPVLTECIWTFSRGGMKGARFMETSCGVFGSAPNSPPDDCPVCRKAVVVK